jgi:threonine dehydrogenase-like Zn-dependent dehydrogenase
MVRRPDPVPCIACAAGEPDMCVNGRFTERGIKQVHGFLAERYAEDPRYLVRIPPGLRGFGVLLEPLSIVEKALEQIHRIQARAVWAPRHALVLGAGSIGTLAALLLRLEGLEVCVYSRGDGGPGRRLSEAAGARFISADDHQVDHELEKEIGPSDVVMEATGHSPLAFNAIHVLAPNGVVCLTGVTTGSRKIPIDASHLNLELVLENKVVFGTVNANHRHFESGVAHLQAIEARWPGLLAAMITSRVRIEQFRPEDLDRSSDLKLVIEVAGAR